MAQLTSEQVYRSLNGAEVKEILLTRFNLVLDNIQQLQHHIELSRVRLTLSVEAEIMSHDGSTVHGQYFTADDVLTLSTALPPGTVEAVYDQAVIDASTQPPDQIREEHGLPVMELRRTPLGIQEEPVIHEGGIRFARTATIDRGRVTIKDHMGHVDSTTVDALKPPRSGDHAPIPSDVSSLLKKVQR
jgi:hypothetical protein